jgi:hypothetical protein
MLKDKRGTLWDLLWNIILLLIFISFAVMLSVWMNNSAKGEAIKGEVIAKQTALLIDSAKPGTTIFVNADIQISGNEVIVIYENAKYSYTFFNPAKISVSKSEGGTELKIT